MNSSKFETLLTRAVVIGGLGCFIPLTLFFQWKGVAQFQRWQMYLVVTTFLVALGIVNKTRELALRHGITSTTDAPSLLWMKRLAVGASFLIGSILSMGFVLMALLFLRGK